MDGWIDRWMDGLERAGRMGMQRSQGGEDEAIEIIKVKKRPTSRKQIENKREKMRIWREKKV